MTTVHFDYTQRFQTIHPNQTAEVTFSIAATVYTDEAVSIDCVWDEHGYLLPMPTEKTNDGRIFLSTMREAARAEAYKLSKA